MRKMIVLLALLLSSFSYADKVKNYPCDSTDSQAIKSVLKVYIDKNSAIHSNDVRIGGLQCAKSYAVAKVYPKKPVTDVATAYLHFEKNKWQVMAFGTAFEEELLSRLPTELKPEEAQ